MIARIVPQRIAPKNGQRTHRKATDTAATSNRNTRRSDRLSFFCSKDCIAREIRGTSSTRALTDANIRLGFHKTNNQHRLGRTAGGLATAKRNYQNASDNTARQRTTNPCAAPTLRIEILLCFFRVSAARSKIERKGAVNSSFEVLKLT